MGQQRVVDVGKEETSPLSGLFFVLGGEPYSLAKYVRVVEGSLSLMKNGGWVPWYSLAERDMTA